MRRPWFSYYVDDFELSGTVGTMTNQEEGAYHRLLRYQWRNGSIPNDVKRLSEIIREPPRVVKKLWETLEKCFPGGKNTRMEDERTKAQAISDKRADQARKQHCKPGASAVQVQESCTLPCDIHISQVTSHSNQYFEPFWKAYPRRAGGNPKTAARKAWEKRVEEESVDILQHGVERYAAFCDATGKTGTEYVKQAVSWLSPRFEGWAQDWGVSGKTQHRDLRFVK